MKFCEKKVHEIFVCGCVRLHERLAHLKNEVRVCLRDGSPPFNVMAHDSARERKVSGRAVREV